MLVHKMYTNLVIPISHSILTFKISIGERKKEGKKKKKIGREMATTGSLFPPPPLSTLSTQSYQGGLLPFMKQHGLNSWEWRRTTDFSMTC